MKLQVSICTLAVLVQSITACCRTVTAAPPCDYSSVVEEQSCYQSSPLSLPTPISSCGCSSNRLSIGISEGLGQSGYQSLPVSLSSPVPLPTPISSCGCSSNRLSIGISEGLGQSRYQPLPASPVPLPTPIPSCGCSSNRLSIGISEGLGQSRYQPLSAPLTSPVPLPTPIPSCGCSSNRLSLGLTEGISRYQPLPAPLPASYRSNGISVGLSEGRALSSYQSVASAPSYGAVSVAVPDYGGVLGITSIGPVSPSGIAVATDVGLAGDLILSGALPYLSAVAFEGQFETNGVVPVSYGCGDIVAITEQIGGANVGVANAIGGLASGGGLLSGNLIGGRSCGCGCY